MLGHWVVQYSCIPGEKLQSGGFPAGHIWCWAGGRIVVRCYFEFLFWLLYGWFYTSPENRSVSTSFQISLKWNLVMFCFWDSLFLVLDDYNIFLCNRQFSEALKEEDTLSCLFILLLFLVFLFLSFCFKISSFIILLLLGELPLASLQD